MDKPVKVHTVSGRKEPKVQVFKLQLGPQWPSVYSLLLV